MALKTAMLGVVVFFALLALRSFNVPVTREEQEPAVTTSEPALPLPQKAVAIHEELNQPTTNEVPAFFSPGSFPVLLAAVLDRIEGHPVAAERAAELQKLVNEVAVTNIPVALLISKDRATSFHDDYRLLLVSRWAENDPAAAAKWVEQNFHFPGTSRNAAVGAAASAWARNNPAAAIDWAQQLPEPLEANSGSLAVAYEIASSDPAAALALAERLPAGESRDDMVTHAAANWASTSPDKALAWATQVADAELRQKAIASIVVEWAETNPQEAATLAVTSLPAGKTQDDAVIGIIQRWAQQAPTEAAAWVKAFPDTSLRLTALEVVAQSQ